MLIWCLKILSETSNGALRPNVTTESWAIGLREETINRSLDLDLNPGPLPDKVVLWSSCVRAMIR